MQRQTLLTRAAMVVSPPEMYDFLRTVIVAYKATAL